MASDVSDIPSDRALVPNLVDRAFMSKYAAAVTNQDPAFGSKDDSVSNSDPLVWGVRVDDHTQTADPAKVRSDFDVGVHFGMYLLSGEALPGEDQQGGRCEGEDVLHCHHRLPPLLGSPLLGLYLILVLLTKLLQSIVKSC